MTNECNKYSSQEMALMNRLRKLWEQHIHWTRSLIISTMKGLGDVDAVSDRLLRNPEDFGDLLCYFYGDCAAEDFCHLLREHLTIAADLVNAIKDNDQEAADKAREKWYCNADEIACFMESLDCCWTKEEWQCLLYSHLEMTEEEAKLIKDNNYKASIAIYDEIEKEALKMADYMFFCMIK